MSCFGEEMGIAKAFGDGSRTWIANSKACESRLQQSSGGLREHLQKKLLGILFLLVPGVVQLNPADSSFYLIDPRFHFSLTNDSSSERLGVLRKESDNVAWVSSPTERMFVPNPRNGHAKVPIYFAMVRAKSTSVSLHPLHYNICTFVL